MHVILVSVGTDGDIFPYVGLGAILRARGHQITLVASQDYASMADAHGLGFRALVSSEENRELFGHPDFWNPLKTAPLAARWGMRFLERQYDLLSKLSTRDALLVASPGILAAALVHEKTGIPLVSVILQPWVIPSSIAPPLMPGFGFMRRAPRPVWKLFWRALDGVVYVLIGRALNRLRASLGLKPLRRILQNWLSPQLVLALFPEWYGEPQADWPGQLQLAGFPLFDGGQGWELPAEVLAFCQSGSPPIAFTFGTGVAQQRDLFRLALEACAVLNRRGIFLTRHRNQLPDALPSFAFHCAFAPFQKLFPHCSAVVHHGGIGTVAQALAAGAPQLIRPICFDQMDNGMRVWRLGAGDWLRRGCADGKIMADALTRLMTPATQSRCQAISARLLSTNGLGRAAHLVEKFAAGLVCA